MENREAIEFIQEIERCLGAKVLWRTFATWFGMDDGTVREYGVFLCTLEDGRVYLEDFERLPQILGYTIKSRNTPKYEKFSLSFPKSAVKSITRVKKKDAETSCRARSHTPLSPAGGLAKALFPLVMQLEMEDGRLIFFEIMDPKEFERNIKE